MLISKKEILTRMCDLEEQINLAYNRIEKIECKLKKLEKKGLKDEAKK